MPIRDEGGEVTKVYVGGSESKWEGDLYTSDWKRTFIFLPKKSIHGTVILPLSTVYTRQREAYSNGQRLLYTDWMTQGEYVMSILRDEK